MRQAEFANNHFYHVYNRGVEKRDIFSSDKDYLRFIQGLYEFNTTKGVVLREKDPRGYASTFRGVTSGKEQPVVEIIRFCLMPNHFHLILKQLKDRGITEFMRKIGTGYTMYFNIKYERSGVLFQGTFKSILIKKDVYLSHLSRYIHLNPLELIDPLWRTEGIKNQKTVLKLLENYRWSSYLDYIGRENFPSITQRLFLNRYFGSEKNYKKFVEEWLLERKIKKDFNRISELILEE